MPTGAASGQMPTTSYGGRCLTLSWPTAPSWSCSGAPTRWSTTAAPLWSTTSTSQRAKSFVNLPGQEAYDAHYTGATLDDVEHFVDDVVLAGHDTMTLVRQAFFDRFLARPNGKTVAENMYQDILTSLF